MYNSKIPGIKKNKYLSLVQSNLVKNFPNLHADVVIHCASLTPVNNLDNSILFKKNIKMMQNIILNINSPKYFFLMSTMSVYGEIRYKKVYVNSLKINPNFYGKSKLECEKILKEYNKKKKVNCFIFRLPGVVGKYSHSNFITKLVNNILDKKEFTISNLNSNFNNIVHVEDIFNFIIHIIRTKKNGFKIMNLAVRKPIKLKKILNYLVKKTRFKNKINTNKNNKNFIIDTSNAIKLGFKSKSVIKTISLFLKQKRLN